MELYSISEHMLDTFLQKCYQETYSDCYCWIIGIGKIKNNLNVLHRRTDKLWYTYTTVENYIAGKMYVHILKMGCVCAYTHIFSAWENIYVHI